MKRLIAAVLVLGTLTAPARSSGRDPYRFHQSTEIPLLTCGAGVLALGTLAYYRSAPSAPENRDRTRIFAPDRFAVDLSSKSAARASDFLLDASLGMPLVFFSRKTFKNDILLLAESNLLCAGLTQLTKGAFARPRPYAYRPEFEGKPLGRDAFRSFVSGHTSAAFNGAVLAAVVYGKRHPGSRESRIVWITGIGLATATGVCRVAAGRHFPTDVLAGAALGTLTGWLVPRLHLGGG
jgi:hypothetical protein